MARFEKEATIGAPAAKVFGYVSDIARHGEWAGDRLEVEKTSEGPLGVGSTFSCVGHQMGTHKGQITVTQYEPGSRVVFESEDDSGRWRHQFVVEGAGGETRLTKAVEPVKLSGMTVLMSPLLPLIVPRTLGADLRRIKSQLEG